MTYTVHGHHIPGTKEELQSRQIASCGGASKCADCAKDTALALSGGEDTLLTRAIKVIRAVGFNDYDALIILKGLNEAGIYLRE